MDFLDDIKKETIIICQNGFKEKILNLNKLLPIKLMSIEEFLKEYLFSYDERAILYIINNYHVKYDIAKMYLKNIYFIQNDNYSNYKLTFLNKIKKDLDDQKLLIYNDQFIEYLKNKQIILYDIGLNEYLRNIFSKFKIKIINRQYKKYEHDVYEFDTIDDECEYIAIKICKLLSENVNIQKIKLTNIDKSYYNTIERIFSLYNLKVNIPYTVKLSSYEITKEFINNYELYDLDTAFNKLPKDNIISKEIIKIVNKYLFYDNKELIIYKLLNHDILASKYNNGIEIIDFIDYFSEDDEYIFMPGFNDGLIPNSYKDIEYITDDIAKVVGLNTTSEKNEYLRNRIIDSIYNIKNLTITYKNSDSKRTYYPSTLCEMFNVIKGEIDYHISYSEKYNKIKLMTRIDDYIKYGNVSKDYDILNHNFEVKYNSYSNKYTKINRTFDSLTLSYSKMQLYNKCAFRYYLTDVLKLDIYEENFSKIIGSTIHYIMEKCLSGNEIDVYKYANEYLKNKQFTKKEQFFIKKYIEAVKELLDQVILEREYSLFNQAMYEKKVSVNFDNNVKFVGIIDKILYYVDNEKTYISLIDYKTGNDDISLKYLKLGLDIQLPIYLYLSSKLEFNNPIYVGFYLQKLNIKDKDYRLVGYSNSDPSILKIGDNNFENSKIIKGMKTLKDGSFSKHSKVLSNDEIENIKKETEDKIISVINNIKKNEFSINPKVINGYNKGCEYCQFKDICYVDKKNYDNIKIALNEVNQ